MTFKPNGDDATANAFPHIAPVGRRSFARRLASAFASIAVLFVSRSQIVSASTGCRSNCESRYNYQCYGANLQNIANAAECVQYGSNGDFGTFIDASAIGYVNFASDTNGFGGPCVDYNTGSCFITVAC